MTDFTRVQQRVDEAFDPNSTAQTMIRLGWSDEAIAAAIEAQRRSDVGIQQATPPPVELGVAVKAFEGRKPFKMDIRSVVIVGILSFGVGAGLNQTNPAHATTTPITASAEGNAQAPPK